MQSLPKLPDLRQRLSGKYRRPINVDKLRTLMIFWLTALLHVDAGGDVVGGSVPCFAINSINRMGGYTGWERFSFDFRTGKEVNLDELDAVLECLKVAPAKDVCS
mgnify:CR=1 FL=1